MPSMIDTPTYRTANTALDGRLATRLRQWRRRDWSGERMARELYLITDGLVDVTGQTVRVWLRQLDPTTDAE